MQRCRALTPDCSSVSRPVWPLIGQYWSRDLNTGLWLVIGWDVCRHIIAVSQPEDTHLFRPCSKQQYDPCYIWTITNLSKVRHLICPARHTCIIFQWAWISVAGSCCTFPGLHSNREDADSYEIINTMNFSIQYCVGLTSACWPRSLRSFISLIQKSFAWLCHIYLTFIVSRLNVQRENCNPKFLRQIFSPELETTVIFTIPAPCIGPRSLSVFSPDK